MPYTCTKTFDCVSTAHRNWRAKANPNRDSKKCSYIHGYTKTFTLVFGCANLDEFQWVYDYGTTSTGEIRTMTALKNFIQDTLDHGVTTDSQDPMLAKLHEMHDLELIKLIVIPVENGQSGSVEGLCRYIYNQFDKPLQAETNGRVWIESVTIHEHHKNSSTYTREQNIQVNVSESPSPSQLDFLDIAKANLGDLNLGGLGNLGNIWSTVGLDKLSGNKAQSQAQVEEDPNKTKEAFEKFESIKNNDLLDKILTKENLNRALQLMQLHPQYRGFATTLLAADELKDMLLKNPDLKKKLLDNMGLIEQFIKIKK